MDSQKRIRLIKKILTNRVPKNLSTLVVDYPKQMHIKALKKLNITYTSSLKSQINEARAIGIKCFTSLEKEFDIVIVSPKKSRPEALYKIAFGYQHLKSGGILAIEGTRRIGINGIIKEVCKKIEADSILAKAHGKIAILSVKYKDSLVVKEWLRNCTPKKNEDGFLSVPGLFSHRRVDPASRFLSSVFDDKISGSVIDLGAGWGFLSVEALLRSSKITSLKLIDNDLTAIKMAKLNVKSPKASFEWLDITETSQFSKTFDTVLCNPPFHSDHNLDFQLGISFINSASEVLKMSGRLLLVSNIHLPYEDAIKRLFKDFKIVKQNKYYKIILATRPKK